MPRALPFSVHAFVLVAAAAALGCGGGGGPSTAQAEGAVTAPQNGVVKMQVTEAGFVPSRIEAKKGVPLTLLITRKTDATCAKEIVIDEHGVNAKLPLDTEVTVTFTPKKTGELKFGCAMDKMIGGVLLIE